MGRKKNKGKCSLTGKTGFYVDSHIIPKALTHKSENRNPFYQFGDSKRPKRRWSSWYDQNLVIEEGEKYLSELDNWAIKELRNHDLVWSSWNSEGNLKNHYKKSNAPNGIRRVEGIDTNKLRLFFLSLLWRATATELNEFKNISLNSKELEQLRTAILGKNNLPLDFFPVQLVQISTKGPIHNQTPVPDTKYLPDLKNTDASAIEIPMYRFYFDGLIAHIWRSVPKNYSLSEFNDTILGVDDSITLVTVTFEKSRQLLDMSKVLRPYSRLDS